MHYFDFWNWVEGQAYPAEFESSDRYDQPFGAVRYDQMTFTEVYQPPPSIHDRYDR